jgi:hypothetical protein
MSQEVAEQQQKVSLPVRQLLVVAAEVSSLASEYEKVANVDAIPQFLADVIQSGDLRVKTIPLPFPTILVNELVDLHAFGILYELGFSRASTLSMVIDVQTGNVVNLEIPAVIEQYAPHLAVQKQTE